MEIQNDTPVVYLTMYLGDLMPKWYIGSSKLSKIRNGYNGSVQSKKYKSTWNTERKANKKLFHTRVLSCHNSVAEALKEELRLQVKHNVVLNSNYINLALAQKDGYFGYSEQGIFHTRLKATGKIVCISSDEYSKNKELYTTPSSNVVYCTDRKGSSAAITKEEYALGGFRHNSYNTVTVLGKDDNYIKVSKEEFSNNANLKGVASGSITVYDTILKENRRVSKKVFSESCTLVAVSKDLVSVIDTNTGKSIKVTTAEFKANTNYVGVNKGRKLKMKSRKCPHCGKEGKGGAMTQWHFDNCRYKEVR